MVDRHLVLGVEPGQHVEQLVVPVEAPDGTAARPKAPLSSVTSTSTVGLPRESRISRPVMSMIAVMAVSRTPIF
jgi:hypothetical protein